MADVNSDIQIEPMDEEGLVEGNRSTEDDENKHVDSSEAVLPEKQGKYLYLVEILMFTRTAMILLCIMNYLT